MNLITLIKLQLKVAFNLSALKWYVKHDKKKIVGGVALAGILIASIIPLYLFVYLNIVQMVYSSGYSLGQPEFVVTMAVVMISLMVMVFGIAFVMSTFYFSRDLSLLIPLPLQPREIIGAKFTTVLVQEYLTVLPLMLPVLYIFGTGQGAGLYFWLSGLLITIMLPIIPLTIVSAAVLLMMRVTNLGKRKDLLRLLGMGLMIVLIIVFNYFTTKFAPMSQEEVMNLIFAEEGLVRIMSRMYPPALVATRAMTAGGLTALFNLAIFTAISFAGVAVMLFLGDRLFYRGLIGGDEVTASKNISASQLEKKMSHMSSPAFAIAMREIKTLLRTPIYVFNSVGVILIIPIAMAVPLVAGDAMDPILSVLQSAGPRILINLGGAAFVGLIAAFAPASSSSFSREGKQFWISQVIPVAPRDQIMGKIMYSLLIAMLAIPLVFLLSFFVTNWTLIELVVVIILGLCISLPAITVSLLIDLIRPYLTWDNPQKAIKQNMNVVLGMVATGGLYFLIYQSTMFLVKQQYNEALIYLAVAMVSFVLGVIPYLIMVKIANQRYRDIVSP
ncbi:MAG: hypothetical protein NUK65_02265 [Firmicutes bacterium]|nr:hypothetical protein [Bacillota bacterium]